jgi:hypothetical protein
MLLLVQTELMNMFLLVKLYDRFDTQKILASNELFKKKIGFTLDIKAPC